MHVGVCKLVLSIPGNDNLKGKRRAVQSLLTRIRAKFNVAIAEVDALDSWQRATLGLTCVSNDGRHVNSMISSVVQFIGREGGEIELEDYEMEIIDGM